MEKPEEASVKIKRTRIQIEPDLPKPVIRSDAETVQIYAKLLDSAPETPMLTNMNEVTAWLDQTYRPWLQQVRHELPK